MSDNLSSHTLIIDGESRTLAGWGLLDARVMLEGLDASMTLVEAEGDWNTSAVTPQKRVELWAPNGRRVFCGVVNRGEEAMEAGALRWRWQCDGPTYWLGRIPYTQALTYFEDPTIEASEEADTAVATVVLNRVPPGAARVNLKDQVAEIVAAAQAGGAPIVMDLDEVPEQELPEQREKVAMLSDVLRALLRSAPQLHLSWEFDTSAINDQVRLRCRRYQSDALGNATGVMKIGAVTETVRQVDKSEVNNGDGLTVTPLYELLVRKLTVQYVWKHVLTIGSRKVVRRGVESQVSTFENGAFGEYRITINLRGAALNNGEVTQEPEPRPAGNLAAWLHEPFARLWHKAEWTWHLDTCAWTVKAGQMVNLLGLGREVQVVAQSVTHEVARGRTSVTAGAPQRLSVLTLPLYERLRGESPNYGSEAEEEDESPYDPETITGVAARQPFDVVDITTALSVVPGLLNNVAPTTIGGTADWTFARLAGKIYLKVVLDKASGSVVTRELRKDNSVPAPTDDGATLTGYLELASISLTGDTISIVTGYNGSRWAHIAWGPVSCAGGTITQPASLAWS